MQNMHSMHNMCRSSVLKEFIRYLLRLENAMNANITPVQRDRRQTRRGIRWIMVFVQKPSDLIWKNSQNSVSAELTSIAMQYCFPSKCMLTQVLTTATGETVGLKSSNLCAVPNLDANPRKVTAGQDWTWSWLLLVIAIREGISCGLISP